MIDDESGKADAGGMSQFVQLPTVRGEGVQSLRTTIIRGSCPAGAEGCPQLEPWQGQEYGPCDTDGRLVCKPNTLAVAPWFWVRPAAGVVALGTYTNASDKNSLVWAQRGQHRVIFSGSTRLPVPAWRAIARAAGVHIFSEAPAAAVDVGGNVRSIVAKVGHRLAFT